MPYKPPKIEKIQYHIREVADMFDLEVSAIRYWEKEFSMLKPHKDGRGTRYFKPKDLDILHLIYHLLKEQKLTLEGAKLKLKNNKAQVFKNFEVVKRLSIIRAELVAMREQVDVLDDVEIEDDNALYLL